MSCVTDPGHPEKITMKQTLGKIISKEESDTFTPTMKKLVTYRN